VIDFGLLVSMIIGFGLPSLLISWWPLLSYDEPMSFIDAALGPAFAGLAVGRLSALALDDPSSIGSISDMLIIRSGVEFWPGVLTAAAVLVWSARRAGLPLMVRLADLVPAAMVGYAGYEAACVFRDGCFGPLSSIGLRPPGLTATMLPVGWFMAAAVLAAAVLVRQAAIKGTSPLVVILLGGVAVSAVRSVGSIWLPHVGDGLTRQHLTSIALVVLTTVGIAMTVLAGRTQTSSTKA